jgi:hypothetical protein
LIELKVFFNGSLNVQNRECPNSIAAGFLYFAYFDLVSGMVGFLRSDRKGLFAAPVIVVMLR